MADVYYAVVRVDIPASNGNFDVTAAALNGKTPKAAIFFGGSYLASGGGAVQDELNYVLGYAANGDTSYSASINAVDNSGNTSNNRRHDAAPIRWTNPSAQTVAVNSWITNGIRLTLAATDVTARHMWCLLIAGDDVQVASDRIDLGTGTAALTQTVGFQADLVFMFGAQRNTTSNAVSGTAIINYGVAHNNKFVSPHVVTQRSLSWGETNTVASGGQPALQMRDDCALHMLNVTNGAAAPLVTASNFTATAFDLTPSVSSLSQFVSFLAINLGGKRAHLSDFGIPTGTGNAARTGIGFEPRAVLLAGVPTTVKNTAAFNDASAAGISFGGFDTSTQYANSGSDDPNADPTDTKQLTATAAMLIAGATTPAASRASFASFDMDGYTLNWTTVSGNASRVFAVALEGNVIPPVGDIRPTNMPVLVGAIVRPPSRVTTAAMLVGFKGTPAQRITNAPVLVGVKTGVPPCLTQEADLWRIARTDGTVYRFTSHDRRITFRGEVYKPCGSISGSALQLSADIGATDNLDLSGIIYEGGVSEADLWSDAFAGAEVQVWRYPWAGATLPLLVAVGTVGSRVFGDSDYKFEIVTTGEKLSQKPILSPVMPTCRFKLGDSRCTINLPALAVTGSVTAVAATNYFTTAHRRVFSDGASLAPDGKFTLGRLTWTSGDNVGVSVDVKSFAADTFVLEQPMPVPISIGDAYSVTPGCDRLAATCHDTFANKINFGGFEHVKGYDDLNKTPDQDI